MNQTEDLEFLKEMKELADSLMEKYDIVKLEHLKTMIDDWIFELSAALRRS